MTTAQDRGRSSSFEVVGETSEFSGAVSDRIVAQITSQLEKSLPRILEAQFAKYNSAQYNIERSVVAILAKQNTLEVYLRVLESVLSQHSVSALAFNTAGPDSRSTVAFSSGDMGSPVKGCESPAARDGSASPVGGAGSPTDLAIGRMASLDSYVTVPSDPGQEPDLLQSRGFTLSLRKKSTRGVGSSQGGSKKRHVLEGGQLPVDWPSSLSLRIGLGDSYVTYEASGQEITDAIERRASLDSTVFMRHSKVGKKVSTKLRPPKFFSKRAMDPNSKFVSTLDLIGFVVLMFDLVMSPSILAWDIVIKDGPLLVLMFIAASYWLIQLVLNFTIGYYQNGDLITKRRQVIWHYLRRWFCFDFVLCTLDWSALMIAEFGDTGVSTRSNEQVIVRVLRMAQVAKVFRMSRLGRLMERTSAWSLSEGSRVALQAAKMIFSILVASHLIACIWFLVGQHAPSDTGHRWLDVPGPEFGEDVRFEDEAGAFQYVTALHWITAQVTLASCYVVPRSTFEGVVSVGLLIYGLLFSGTIVSILSAHTVQLVMMRQEQTKKLATLRRYLRERSVNPILAARIHTQAVHRLSRDVPLKEEDVPALKELSLTLRHWLLFETRLPHLTSHALFQVWWRAEEAAVETLCENAEIEFFSPQDVLFVPAKSTDEMFHITQGTLRYTQEPQTSRLSDATEQEVDPGIWVCEAALWSDWTHVGKLEAESQVQILKLTANGMSSILDAHKLVASITKGYARSFHLRLTTACPPHADWPSDLGVPFTEPSDLLSMDVGIGLLRAARAAGRVTLTDVEAEQLEQEIRLETCSLHQNQRGELERIAAVMCVHLVREDGCLLVHVGTHHPETGLSVYCRLPGHKRPHGELPKTTLKSLLETDLAPFQNGMKLLHAEHDVQVKEERFGGIRAKYLRNVQNCLLRSGFDPGLSAAKPACSGKQFQGLEVLMIPSDGDKVHLYSWMSASDFDFAGSTMGLKLLEAWLHGLKVDVVRASKRIPPAQVEILI